MHFTFLHQSCLSYWYKKWCCVQWFVLTRKHAEAVVADTTVLPVFVENCQVWPFIHSCVPVFTQGTINSEVVKLLMLFSVAIDVKLFFKPNAYASE